jgi:hypothetical protein
MSDSLPFVVKIGTLLPSPSVLYRSTHT